jgi:hypothetical protein
MQNIKRLTRLVPAFFAVGLTTAGCGGPIDDVDSLGTFEAPLSEGASLLYEGSCAFLRNCSFWGGTPTCNGRQNNCSDTTRWVAVPNSSYYNYCGKTVYLCRTDSPCTCTSAQAWDNSDKNSWEGNVAVFQSLGAAYSDGSGCPPGNGGYGMVNVRVMDYSSYIWWLNNNYCPTPT